MKKLPFRQSSTVSIGVELEIQLINPASYDLIAGAKDLIRNIRESIYQDRFTPEITQSMIEINSSVHHVTQNMHEELLELQFFLTNIADKLGILFCGGGTHPFQKWSLRKIFPTKRFKNLSRQYRYLSQNSTVFGQHIHIGCKSGEDAIYLTHALARFVPHFIAISASSPFYQGIDTGYCSSRSNVFTAFPLSGVIPYLTNWQEFSAYFYKMRNLGIVHSMKDFYWDIRPKPEFGTVEFRVCDMPLTISKVISITAYLQALSLYLLEKKPVTLSRDLYFLYNYNRFQACRYGFDGVFIDPKTFEHRLIIDDLLMTIKQIEEYAHSLNNMTYLSHLINDINQKHNDAMTLRQILKQVRSYTKLVQEQCLMWSKT